VEDLEEFKQKLITQAKAMVVHSGKQLGEAATNMVLVQPFLSFLGYDITNPDEVAPEHHADFSDKYKNKVDYAIMRNGHPVIAIESKKLGGVMKDDLGQLKSYFNACPTVKLGILTDGLRFDFFADSDSPNMMDDNAFLKIDMQEVAKGNIDDNSLRGLSAIRKADFNPENVGAEAKRKLLIQFIVQTLRGFKTNPSDEFIRLFLSTANLSDRISKKSVDSNRQVISDALQSFIDQEILSRVGYAPKDVVKKIADVPEIVETAPAGLGDDRDEEQVPTEAELAMLANLKERLAFLVKTDSMYDEIANLSYRKTAASIRVFYKKPNKGSLFSFHLTKTNSYSFKFHTTGKEFETTNLKEINEPLLQSFIQRLEEHGVSIEKAPILRSVS
jgi:hypothetical protein